MTNKFPLIADNNRLKELRAGDNLDLTGSGISIGGSQGSSGQVLSSTGSGLSWKTAAGRWSQISTATVTSSVAGVGFTNLSGYDEYEVRWFGLESGDLSVVFDYGSGLEAGNTYNNKMVYTRDDHGGSYAEYKTNYTDSYVINMTRGGQQSGYGMAHGTIGWTSKGGIIKYESYLHGATNNQGAVLSYGTGSNQVYKQNTITGLHINYGGTITSGTFSVFGLSLT